MNDWLTKLDAFLQFQERDILSNAGKVEMAVVKQLAEQQYEVFHRQRLHAEAVKADELDKLLDIAKGETKK